MKIKFIQPTEKDHHPKLTMSSTGNTGDDNSFNRLDIAMGTVGMIYHTIKNNRYDDLRKLLLLIPFKQMTPQTADNFFTTFLYLCAEYSRNDCIKLIYDKWDLVYPPNERIPVFSMMVMMPLMKASTLAFLNDSLIEDTENREPFTYIDVMYDLVSYDSNPYLQQGCRKAIEIFGQQSNYTYGLIMNIAIYNPDVYEYISHMYRKDSNFAKIPTWMGNSLTSSTKAEQLEISNELPLESEYPLIIKEMGQYSVPNIDRVIDLLTEGMGGIKESVESKPYQEYLDARDKIRRILISATPQQKIEIVKPVMELRFQEGLQNDIELFRNSGPSNPMEDSYGDDLEYDGCRMFTCMVFDYNEEDHRFEDWYEGYCHQCNLRIRRRWHAVRIPGEKGGWIGCFCSWKCARESLDDVGYNPEMEPKTIQHMLIDFFEKQLLEIGIQDRITDNAEVAKSTSKLIVDSLENYDM